MLDYLGVVVLQSLNHVRLFVTPRTVARQASLSFTVSQSLLKLISIESMMPSNHLILCRPHFLLLSIFPIIRVCSNELARHIRWPKYWSFSIGPSKVYSGLISFKMDWFDLLAVQGILKIFSSITVQKHQFFKCLAFNTLSMPITSRQIVGETMETAKDFILGGSKITADGDCSHEIKGHLLLGRKAMTHVDSILKSRDITLPTKVCLVKAMVFPIIMYGCES